jgi:hypothetical protein
MMDEAKQLLYVAVVVAMIAIMAYAVGVYPKERLCEELAPLGVSCPEPIAEVVLGTVVRVFQEVVMIPYHIAVKIMGG